jgi:NAD(P)-dependent dehydrogenase (short-subunit alcohol dehydrogenase family)
MNAHSPVVIVTAASHGIGEGCARGLAERGFRLVLMSRSEASLRLAEEIGGIGIQGSVTEARDLQDVVELAVARYGRVDGVVNNTGRFRRPARRVGSPARPERRPAPRI